MPVPVRCASERTSSGIGSNRQASAMRTNAGASGIVSTDRCPLCGPTSTSGIAFYR